MNNKSLAPQFITIEKQYEHQRIDNFLFNRLKGVPKSRIYRLLRRGSIRVNKKRVRQDYKLQIDDVIRLPKIEIIAQKPHQISKTFLTKYASRLECLYEDDDFLVINKPAGLAVHAGSGQMIDLMQILHNLLPQFPGLTLAHRLDKQTSGCLLLAKNRQILYEFQQLLMANKVEKIYKTLLLGHLPREKILLKTRLQKNVLTSGERMVVVDDDNGKIAISEFNVDKNFNTTQLIRVRILTGRTHQIRVHAAHMGHPIANDDKYGDREFNQSMRAMGLRQMFLHAYSLRFKLLSNHKEYCFVAPLTENLQQIVEKLS